MKPTYPIAAFARTLPNGLRELFAERAHRGCPFRAIQRFESRLAGSRNI